MVGLAGRGERLVGLKIFDRDALEGVWIWVGRSRMGKGDEGGRRRDKGNRSAKDRDANRGRPAWSHGKKGRRSLVYED